MSENIYENSSLFLRQCFNYSNMFYNISPCRVGWLEGLSMPGVNVIKLYLFTTEAAVKEAIVLFPPSFSG
jgi:hypothetical protein